MKDNNILSIWSYYWRSNCRCKS